MSRWASCVAVAALFALATSAHAQTKKDTARNYGIGRAISAEQIAGWDIDVRPDGQGAPPGRGSVKDGERSTWTNVRPVTASLARVPAAGRKLRKAKARSPHMIRSRPSAPIFRTYQACSIISGVPCPSAMRNRSATMNSMLSPPTCSVSTISSMINSCCRKIPGAT